MMKKIANTLIIWALIMREMLYYIGAAILGGLVKDLNSTVPLTKSRLFVSGLTSVAIGIIFGLLTECITHNVKLSIALSALGGVWGYNGLTAILNNLKKKLPDINIKV